MFVGNCISSLDKDLTSYTYGLNYTTPEIEINDFSLDEKSNFSSSTIFHNLLPSIDVTCKYNTIYYN